VPNIARRQARALILVAALVGSVGRASAGDPIVPAHGAMPLPSVSLSAEDRPYESFMGSPGVSIEAVALYGFGDELLRLRPTAIVRFGPLVVGLGVVISDGEVAFNAHLEAFSFQSHGWEIALGAGLEDGGTLRFGIPIVSGLRVRVMTAIDGSGFVAGLGLETAPW
jgi:hypothetical protein